MVTKPMDSEPMPTRYLDFMAVALYLAELGITDTKNPGQPVPVSRVRRWADKGKLSFRKGPDGKRRIALDVLERELREMHAPSKRHGG